MNSSEEITRALDELSGGLPNGSMRDLLIEAADKIDELNSTINSLRLEKDQIDWLRLKVK